MATEALPKVALYLALLCAVGACSARWLSASMRGRQPAEASAPALQHGLGVALSIAAVGLIVALLVRAWAHTVAAFGVSDALVWENLRLMAWESEWGSAWRLQVALALTLVIVSVVIRVAPRGGWIVASAMAVALCYALPLLGHAEGEPARVMVHGTHLLGAGAWLGSLATLRFAHRHGASLDRDLARFAPLALSGAAAIGITGALSTWMYLRAPSDLWSQPYGRALLLKLGVVAGVALCGLSNWRFYRGGRAMGSGTPDASRAVTAELLLAALAVVVTAVLTELPHP